MQLEQQTVELLNLLDEHLVITINTDYTFTANDGKPDCCAFLHVNFSNPAIYFSKIDCEKGRNNYIKNKKRADCLLLEKVGDLHYKIHIIELKNTIKPSSWDEIKLQQKGSILEAIIWCNFLGVKYDLNDINVYTGYRHDKMATALAASPIERKLLVGQSAKSWQSDWHRDKYDLDLISRFTVKHWKVELDHITGKADMAI